LEGIQQQHKIRLGPPPRKKSTSGWSHYDNLDLSWSSTENGGLKAGRGNSGGPMLWHENGSLSIVGISREVKEDQQVGSWIGWERRNWLRKALGPRQPPAGPMMPQRIWKALNIDEAGQVVFLDILNGVTRIQATLNASQGLRLQMGIESASNAQSLLTRLQSNNRSSGRFLFRSAEVPKDSGKIAIGICPVATAPRKAESVQAQLCVLFS
jgi:hypothetical protein